MKAMIVRATLAKAMDAVKGIAPKDRLSRFADIRLDATGGNFSLTATDGTVQVEYRVPCDEEGTGSVAVPGAQFLRFADSMPEGVVTVESRSPGRVEISGGGVNFRLPAHDALDFATMAGPGEGAARFSIPERTLCEMLRKVRYAAARDERRAVLCGVNLSCSGAELLLTATDGRRLSNVAHEVDVASGGKCAFDVTLPNRATDLLFGMLDGEETLSVEVDGKAIRIVGDSCCFTAKVLADAYPNWRQIVPDGCKWAANLDRMLFLKGIRRAALASEEGGGVTVALHGGKMRFVARNKFDEARIEVDGCSIGMDSATFTVDWRLMSDALSSIDEDRFALRQNGPGSALEIRCSLPWVAVVMPFRKEG